MKKEDKEIIYDLLKKADTYVTGFKSSAFEKDMAFEDDVVQNEISQVSQTEMSQVQFSENSQGIQNQSTSTVNEGLSLEDLKSKILRCTKCQLARTRNNVVPGEGVENPDVLVIGEGPGYDEDMSGRPFVGKAGVLLDKMLAAINLDRTKNCYIANVVKCRPPNNRDPELDEQAACSGFLEAQIHLLKPKMILCMGRIAGHKMLDTQVPLGQLRGQFHEYNGIPLMVTYHPSALLRDESLKAPAWQDLKAFRKKLDEIKGQ